MAPSPSTEPTLDDADCRTLLDVARSAIGHALIGGKAMRVDPANFSEALRASRAVFVTLTIEGQLRGCIGSLEPVHTLVEDVARHAVSAAMRDPRFPPLTTDELQRIGLHISVLSPPEPIDFTDERDLIEKIRPGVDGLILEGEGYRGTFLPSVWDMTRDAARFLDQLKLKAGLKPGPLPADARILRYTAQYIE